MICPRCDGQGSVWLAKIIQSGELIQICDECDATWPEGTLVSSTTFVDFATYVQPLGLRGQWSEIELIDQLLSELWRGMDSHTGTDAGDIIRSCHDFEESLLQDVKWLRYGCDIQLVINLVRQSDNSVRPDILGNPELVGVTCRAVQDFHMVGGLSDQMCSNPGQIDWGLSELSRISVIRLEIIEPAPVSRPKYQVEIKWERDRRICIQCVEVELSRLKSLQ